MKYPAAGLHVTRIPRKKRKEKNSNGVATSSFSQNKKNKVAKVAKVANLFIHRWMLSFFHLKSPDRRGTTARPRYSMLCLSPAERLGSIRLDQTP